VISKIDQLKNRDELYPFVARIAALYQFDAVVPVSSTKRHQLDQLLDEVAKRLPENEPFFDADTLTDRPVRFIAAELSAKKSFVWLVMNCHTDVRW
jgi:GTPase